MSKLASPSATHSDDLTTRRVSTVSPTPRRPTGSTGFRQLTLTNWRELVREPKTLFFTMFFPLLFLAMFGGLSVLMDRSGDPPVVAVGGDAPAAVTAALADAGVATAAPGAAATMTVTTAGARATVHLAAGAGVARSDVIDALREAGFARAAIAVLQPDGSPAFDPLRGALPTVLMVGLLSLALLGTAAPLVGLRGRGTLRLLGTTPVRRWTFILAQTPPRLLLGAAQVAIVAIVAALLGYLQPAELPALAVTCVLGLLMVLALGYLFASRMISQDLATTVASLLLPVAMMLGGSMLPTQLMPAAVQQAADLLPTTMLSKALAVSLTGSGSGADLPALWGGMALVAVVATALAATLFTWDQGEHR